MQLTSASHDEIWMWLRATRWNPPAAAKDDDERRKTYGSALEQAEQLFRAAAGVGAASRPLLIFYGLSQAGRAIAAAASAATGEGAWRLRGHGISQVAASLAGPLPEVAITTSKRGSAGSFVRLSELLASPVWGTDGISLEVLWDSIPENRDSPLTEVTQDRRTPLQIDDRDLSSDPHPLAVVPVWPLPPWVVTSDSAESLGRYMQAFPGAAGYSHPRRRLDVGSGPAYQVHVDGWGGIDMHWRVPEGSSRSREARLALLHSMTRPYGHRRYFFPALGTNEAALHPLMAWWAILHSLSMLARYQPAEWGDHIDVDRSRFAVPIEAFQETALQVVPRLIAYTIDEVCDGELTSR